MKQADTDGTGGPDEQRLMHYSDRWQLLEEDVWDDWTEQTPGDVDRHIQYVRRARCFAKTGDCPELPKTGDCPELPMVAHEAAASTFITRHVEHVPTSRGSSRILLDRKNRRK